MDEQTDALYRAHIAPRLREDEEVVFAARWRPIIFVGLMCFAILFFGDATLSFYRDYYVFDTIEAACGRDISCRKYYPLAWWYVPMVGAMTAVSMFCLIVTFFGVHRQVYAITNQRVICARIGLPRGFDAFELENLEFRRGSTGLKILKGKLQISFYLGGLAAQAAEVCLVGVLRGRRT